MDGRSDESAGREGLLRIQRQRALKAEARRKEIEAQLQAALDQAEEHRIVAIELRTMLDATYYRISTLEEEVRVRESESAALSEGHAADVARLGAAAEETARRLAEVERERESARHDAARARVDLEEGRSRVATEIGSLRAELEERAADCRRVDDELRRALDAEGELRRSVAELTSLRAKEEIEAAELRAWIETLERELDIVRDDQTSTDERCIGLTAEVESLNAALAEARSWAVGWQAAVEEHRGEVDRLARGLEAAAETERALHERLGAVDIELARVQEELAQTRGALSIEQWAHTSNLESLRAMVAEQARQVVDLGARLEEAGETSAALEGRLGEVVREAARRAQDRERLAGALAAVQAERDHWRHEWQGAAAATAELERDGETIRARARDAGERAERAEERLFAVQAEIDALRADLTAGQERLRGGEEWSAALQERVTTLEQERALLDQLRAEDAEGLQDKEETLGEALEAGAHLWRELAESLRTREFAESEIQRLEEHIRTLGGRLEGEAAEKAEIEGRLAAAGRELDGAREDLERRADEAATRHAELEERLEAAYRELEHAREEAARQAGDRAEKVESLEAECERLQARVEQVEHDRLEIEDRLAAVEQLRQELAQQVTALRGQLEEREGDLFRLRCSLEETDAERRRSTDVEARLAEERDAAARRCREAEDRSAVLQREIDALRSSAVPPERYGEMEMQIEQLRGAVAMAQDAETRLHEALDDLQQQLLREQAHSTALWSDLESQNRFREALDSALSEARARYGELESALQREQRRWSEQEAIERDSAAETASLLARAQLIETRAGEIEEEREALQAKVTRLEASREGLEKECEQLRRRAAQVDDREASRFQSRIEDLERQHREAVQRHSGAVSGYMLELNQRTETLRQRDVEIHRLAEELQVMQGTCDDAVGQLAELKNERDALAERVRDLETSRPAPAERARPVAPTAAAPAPPTRNELRIADEAQAPPEEKKRAPQMPVAPPRKAVRHHDDEPLSLLHAEEDAILQEVVRSAVTKFPTAHYAPLSGNEQERADGRPLLALNMLSRTLDPIAILADCGKLGIDDPAAFTYFAYGGKGFVAGMVDFFPHPFEPDGCASRLLGRSGGLQRLLAVSEDVDAMTGIREVLGRVRCSAATAFDGRQAMDLLPMIRPEVVLVDLSLPRGEALRVVSRICTDPKTASIGIALFWTQPITQKELGQAALRVVRDYPLTPEDLEARLTRMLNDEEFGLVTGEGIRASA